MIGVGVRRGVLTAAGEVLGAGEGVAGLGDCVFEALAIGAGVIGGFAVGVEPVSKVMAPAFHICPTFAALISNSIGSRLGFAGWVGSAICFPLMNN